MSMSFMVFANVMRLAGYYKNNKKNNEREKKLKHRQTNKNKTYFFKQQHILIHTNIIVYVCAATIQYSNKQTHYKFIYTLKIGNIYFTIFFLCVIYCQFIANDDDDNDVLLMMC